MDFHDYRRPAPPAPDEMLWQQKTMYNYTQSDGYTSFFQYYIILVWYWRIAHSSPPGVIGYEVYYSLSTGEGGAWVLAATRDVDELYLLGYTSDSEEVPESQMIEIPSTALAIKIVALTGAGTFPDLDLILYGDLDIS